MMMKTDHGLTEQPQRIPFRTKPSTLCLLLMGVLLGTLSCVAYGQEISLFYEDFSTNPFPTRWNAVDVEWSSSGGHCGSPNGYIWRNNGGNRTVTYLGPLSTAGYTNLRLTARVQIEHANTANTIKVFVQYDGGATWMQVADWHEITGAVWTERQVNLTGNVTGLRFSLEHTHTRYRRLDCIEIVGTPISYPISGTVTADGNLLAGVTMNGLPGTPVTGGDGVYTATVNHGWGGTVTPALEGYTFAPASRSYTNVTGDQTGQNYTATLNQYEVTFSLDGKGTHIGGGALVQMVAHGDAAVAPEVEADAGWLFVGWDVPLDNITSPLIVTAQYSPISYTVVYVADPPAGGSVSGPASINHDGTPGDSISVTAAPNAGWNLDNVSASNGAIVHVSGDTYTLSGVTGNTTVTAEFSPVSYTVDYVADPPAGGLVDGPATINHPGTPGDSISVTAAPNAGWNLDNVSASNGTIVHVSGDTYTLSGVTGNTTVTAEFSPISYTVDYVADPPAGGSVSGPASINHAGTPGDSISVTVTTNAGWNLDNVSASDGAIVHVSGDEYTLSGVTANTTVTAEFSPISYTVDYVADQPAGGSVSGPASINHAGTPGDSISVTVTTNAGWNLDNVGASNGVIVHVSGNAYTLSGVTANTTVTAIFEEEPVIEGEGEPAEGEGEPPVGLQVNALSDTQVMALPGESVTFAVSVEGAVGPLSYQWYFLAADESMVPIPNANNSTYTMDEVAEDNAGRYLCEVYDDVLEEHAWSPIFTLTIGTGLPTAGLFGLALAAAFAAVLGVVACRRHGRSACRSSAHQPSISSLYNLFQSRRH